jgi:uncharacterized protein (DUF1778 family)
VFNKEIPLNHTEEDLMGRKKAEPGKKRIPRHNIRANDEEWEKIRRNAASSKSVNDFVVKELIK